MAALPPRLQDAVVAVALALINIVTLLPYREQLHPQPVAFLLVVLESLPLIWRRTWPVAVFLVIGIAREIYDQVPLGYAPLPLGPAIAYFTVMDRCSTRVRLAISLLVLVGIIESQSTPGHSEPYDFIGGRAGVRRGRDGRPFSAGPGGPTWSRSRPGRPGPNPSVTRKRRWPRPGNGPASPVNCTMSSLITSA